MSSAVGQDKRPDGRNAADVHAGEKELRQRHRKEEVDVGRGTDKTQATSDLKQTQRPGVPTL